MKRVVEHDLPLHRLEKQKIPDALIGIVRKATAKSPEDRFPNAKAMADQLETWLVKTGRHVSASIVSAFFAQHKLFVEPRFASVRATQITNKLDDQSLEEATQTGEDGKQEEAPQALEPPDQTPEEALRNVPVGGVDTSTDDELADYILDEDVSGPVELLTEEDFDESVMETDAAEHPEVPTEDDSFHSAHAGGASLSNKRRAARSYRKV